MTSNFNFLFDDADGVVVQPPVPSLQYWAGLFDGEGHVCISNKGRVEASISQKQDAILHVAAQEFGGKVYSTPSKTSKCSAWKLLDARGVLSFLEDIRPYTRIKSAEIDIVIECVKLIRPKDLGHMAITEENRRKRLDLRNKLQKLRPRSAFGRVPKGIVKHVSKEQIVEAMDSSATLDDACAKLGISRLTLYEKRMQFGLPKLRPQKL